MNPQLSINVYGYKDTFLHGLEIFPVRVSSNTVGKKIHLLAMENGNSHHFCWIKNLAKLSRSGVTKYKNKIYLCDRCLNYFATEVKLQQHSVNCGEKEAVRVQMPETDDERFVEFKDFNSKERVEYMVYADFEALLVPQDHEHMETDHESYTQKIQKHIPYSVGYYVHCTHDPNQSFYKAYRGADCVKWFVHELEQVAYSLEQKIKHVKPMCPLTVEQELDFMSAEKCHICGKDFVSNSIRVRDHSHRTGVFPYEYMSSWGRLQETKLPPKEAFYSVLTDEHITDEDYNHAIQVWNTFNLHTLGDYSDLYMKTDVLLLADIFENFRNTCIHSYGLDPSQYYTLPGYTWSAMSKYTNIKLELFTDIDDLLFIEKGIRGGVSQCSNRYAKANNKYMEEGYDKTQEDVYLMYYDVVNLYGAAMCGYLPTGNFKWVDTPNIEDVADDSPVGYILEVDLEIPQHLHDYFSDLPPCPETTKPPGSKQKYLLVRNTDVYEVMKQDINRFDTADYAPDNVYGMPLRNKKVKGLMSDENNGDVMLEFVGLRSKMFKMA
ncbi:uncharacterized protein LOC123295419 [Chrysoperla carnea]|uniref:uncharacterized protein LOC123295419 n=1 Tax=Chrysoperla carnea TaxID=189513 RepID=UPI001D074185|nr:uncharacterized protein LOC123295419 [Chrysoperla carnea]